MKKIFLLIFTFLITFICLTCKDFSVFAETLSNNIKEQMDNLDFSSLEEFLNGISSGYGNTFINSIYSILNGQFNTNESFFGYIVELFISNVKQFLPSCFVIIAISIFCLILNNVKSSFASEGVADVVFFVGSLTVLLILSNQMISLWSNGKKTLENISKFNEIMSPIILTLMVASGGSVSATIFKPTVAIFSNLVINVIVLIVMPLIALIIIFSIISTFSNNIKLTKFIDFFNSIIKWIIGIVITCYGLFVSVNGISSALHDGISLKAIKYTVSNSIPLVGGFLKDGFDLIVAGSILIKNAVGVAGVGVLFSYVLSPVINVAVFILLLKFISAITETINDSKISNICTAISKSFSLLNSAILLVSFMMFVSILLMIFSASAFV